MIKKIVTILTQKLADIIIEKMSNSTDEDTIKYLYDFGMMLDSFCINNFDIYLE
jgi:hypothetical protein